MKQILLIVTVWLLANALTFLLGYGRNIRLRRILIGLLITNAFLAVGALVWFGARWIGINF